MQWSNLWFLVTESTKVEAVEHIRSTAQIASALRPAVLRLARRLRQMRAHDLDLGTGQLQALGSLYRHGALPIGELAQLEKVKPPSMTRTVDNLEALGLATRNASDADRRRSMVLITAAGRALVEQDRDRRDAWLAQRIAALSPEERDLIRRAIPILEQVTAE